MAQLYNTSGSGSNKRLFWHIGIWDTAIICNVRADNDDGNRFAESKRLIDRFHAVGKK